MCSAMASSTVREFCAKCKRAGSVAMCTGCKSAFCTNHFIEHRQNLALEMDTIGQNYDLLRRDISEKNEEHPLLVRINAWEENSIKKIHQAAETARVDLQKLLDEVKSDLESSILETMNEIRISREEGAFLENEFNRWDKQLAQYRQAFEAPCNVSLENDKEKEHIIELIKLCRQQQSSVFEPSVSIEEEHFHSVAKRGFFLLEKFDSKTDAKLSDDNLIVSCVPKYGSPGTIVYGCNLYSTGIYDISFRIEKKGLSRLFFGIYSTQKKRVDAISSGQDNSVYGWWDMDVGVSNGTRQDGGSEQIINTGDKIVLTLDCDHQQIQLYHIRENRQAQLSVDLNKCPFPWKILVKLTANNDCVRIL